MKKILLCLTLLSAAVLGTGRADTPVSGQIQDGRWTKDLSPYKIQGHAVLPEGSVLKVEPGVHVTFEGQATLEVRGSLQVEGSSSDPADFDLMQGGLNSYLLVKGGEFKATNGRFLGGVMALEDAKVDVEGCEIAKGSGPYLLGHTVATFRNNKIYGNASGATLDGDGIQATFEFNTLVQNTYGLHLKRYATLKFENNSVRDNRQFQVVNASPKTPMLQDNFWGSTIASQIQVQGRVDLGTPKALKDVIRAYVKTQLPKLPAAKVPLVAKRAQAEKAAEKSDARKADALRKKMADDVIKAEKDKKLAEARKVREEKAKEAAVKRAEARKAAAEALAAKKQAAAEALAGKKKAAAEALAQKKAAAAEKRKAAEEAKKAAAPAVEAAPAVPATSDLELSPAAAEPTAQPAAPAMEVPSAAAAVEAQPTPATAPAMEVPSAVEATQAKPALEIPDVPVMEAPAVQETPVPTVASPAKPEAAAQPPAATAASVPPPATNTAPSDNLLDIPAPPAGDGASALETFNPSDIPAPPGAPAAVAPATASPATPATPEAKKAESVSAVATPDKTPTTAAAPPAIPSDLAPPSDLGDLGKLDLPPMSDQAVSAPKDMDLPPVDDLGKLNLDLK